LGYDELAVKPAFCGRFYFFDKEHKMRREFSTDILAGEMTNTKRFFRNRLPGVRKYESYICRVPYCGTDCGDLETLLRHMHREHPDMPPMIENPTMQ